MLTRLRDARSRLDGVLRGATWICVAALAALSLIPGPEMIRTGLDGRIEHVAAYFGTTLIAGLAYAGRVGLLRIAVPLAAYAGMLELGQNLSPGRTPSALDFLAGTGGIVLASVGLRAGRLAETRGASAPARR